MICVGHRRSFLFVSGRAGKVACEKGIVSVAELLLLGEILQNKKLPRSSATAAQADIKIIFLLIGTVGQLPPV